MFVGDSFTFGWEVEQTERFSNQLGTMLGVRTFNLAMPSTNFAGYEKLVHYAERNGASIGRLVVGVSMENDLCNYEQLARARRSARPRHTGFSFGKAFTISKKSLATYTASYHALTSVMHQIPILKSFGISMGLVVDNIAGMLKNEFDPVKIRSSAIQLAEIASKYHTTIVIIPSRGLWTGDNQSNERLVHEAFLKNLREQELTVVDLRPQFEQSGDPLSYHFKFDGHWNRDGHRLAAKAIASRVQR